LFDQQDGPEPVARGGVMTPFPLKLHDVLKNIEEDGLADIISWQPHGRCFVVHKPDVFLKDVMPKYFSQTRIASFQRQLNLYGFNRITKGPDKNGYVSQNKRFGKFKVSTTLGVSQNTFSLSVLHILSIMNSSFGARNG
jgi:hypothetical protein